MTAPSEWKNRWLIAALPLTMILLWLAVIAAGDGRVDGLGNPVGGDFAMFYIAANMACQGEWSLLYNEAEQQRRLVALFPALPLDTYLPYRYPPHLAMLLSPLGALPYRLAQSIWSVGCLTLWLVTWWGLVRLELRPRQLPLQTARANSSLAKSSLANSSLVNTCVLALIASPIMAQTLIDGQASFLWMAILSASWIAIGRERYVLAGVCLALAACKPNVLLLLGVLLAWRYPRVLWGVVPAGLAWLGLTVSVCGLDCLVAYGELGRQLASGSWSVETPYWKVQSLLSWSELCVGSHARRVNLGLGLILVAGVGWWWRARDGRQPAMLTKQWNACVAISLGALLNALFNPYTPVYDLLLLSLPLFMWLVYAEQSGLLSAWLARRDVQLIVGCFWAGPIISQCLARELATPQQWMPLVMAIAAIQLAIIAMTTRWPAQAGPGEPLVTETAI